MPTTYTLEVAGTIWANGSTIVAGSTTWSDARFKKNITPIENPITLVKGLKGVYYDWDYSAYPDRKFSKGHQIGFIAQDIEKILPEVVLKGEDGFLSVDYGKVTPLLLEAIKEQQTIIESQENRINELQGQIQQLKEIVSGLMK